MIFLDTNVVSELMRPEPQISVLAWIKRHEEDLALSTIAIAEISFGIERIRPAERSHRLERTFKSLRGRLKDNIFDFDEVAALAYGHFSGLRKRSGEPVAIADGMIAAVALRHKAQLATRNTKHFLGSGLRLINPWTD
jgi:predicted nucleic acid-binding protein